MATENDTLTAEEQLALEQEEARKKAEGDTPPPPLRELTEEEELAIVEKRLGGKPSDFIKKSEQVKVLTDEEKKELEEKEHNEDLKLAIEKGWITRKAYDSFLELKNSDKIGLAKKKFIETNPDLGDDAEAVWNNILRMDEDDEIESGEVMKPNKEKLAAKAWAMKIADEEIYDKYGRLINELPEKRKAYLAEEALKKVNTELIGKVATEIPRSLEFETEGAGKFSIALTEDDIKEAQQIAETAVSQKDLTADEVKGVIVNRLMVRNFKNLLEEGIKVAVSAYADANDRGAKGITDKNTKSITNSDARSFLDKHDIPYK